MKMFVIKLHSETLDFAANRATQFRNALFECSQVSEPYEFFVKGEKVTISQAIEAADKAIEAAIAKKNETHKQIVIGTGVSHLNKRKIWVLK